MSMIHVPAIEADNAKELFAKLATVTEEALREAGSPNKGAGDRGEHVPEVTAAVTETRRPPRLRANKGETAMTDTTVAQRPSNAPTFADLEKIATELGTLTGQGKNSFSQFLLKITEAGFLGTLDVDPNKHGNGVDDAQKLTGTYVKAQTGATIFDAKAPNQRVTTSKARTMIRFSMWSKGGTGEPMGMLNKFVARRQQLRKDPAMSKRLDDASNCLVAVARAQLKSDHLLQASDFDQYLLKKKAAGPTEEAKLEAIRKAANSKLLDQATSKAIARECTKRLAAIAQARQGQAA